MQKGHITDRTCTSKVELSLCLTKYEAFVTNQLLN
jgi:hypothetical protein